MKVWRKVGYSAKNITSSAKEGEGKLSLFKEIELAVIRQNIQQTVYVNFVHERDKYSSLSIAMQNIKLSGQRARV